jgi:hypothetical protein
MSSIKVLAICLGLYALYLPPAWLVHRDYVREPQPAGDLIELLSRFEHDRPDHYVVRSQVFKTAAYPDTLRLTVFENLTPLPREGVTFTPENGVYIVRFRATDGSDPRSNGRRYWLVGD